jgi:hypothetical protein
MHNVRCHNCEEIHSLTEEEFDILETEGEDFFCNDCFDKCVYCGHLLGDEIGYHSKCVEEEDCGCRPAYGMRPSSGEFYPEEPDSNLGVYIIPCGKHESKSSEAPDRTGREAGQS